MKKRTIIRIFFLSVILIGIVSVKAEKENPINLYEGWHYSFPANDTVTSQPVYDNCNKVIYVSCKKNIYAINAEKGSVLWKYETNCATSQISLAGNCIYFGTDKSVYCLSLDGKLKWQFTPDNISGSFFKPLWIMDKIVCTNSDNKIYILESDSGKLRNLITIPACNGNITTPAIACDSIFAVGSKNFCQNQITAYSLDDPCLKMWDYSDVDFDTELYPEMLDGSNLFLFKTGDLGRVYCFDSVFQSIKWLNKGDASSQIKISGGCEYDGIYITYNYKDHNSSIKYLVKSTGQTYWMLNMNNQKLSLVDSNDIYCVFGSSIGNIYVYVKDLKIAVDFDYFLGEDLSLYKPIVTDDNNLYLTCANCIQQCTIINNAVYR